MVHAGLITYIKHYKDYWRLNTDTQKVVSSSPDYLPTQHLPIGLSGEKN